MKFATVDQPIPRFRWFIRGLVAFGLIFLLLLGLRLFIAHRIDRELAVHEQQVRAVGGMWREKELDAIPPLSDDQNAATVYLRAAAMFNGNWDGYRNGDLYFEPSYPLPDRWLYICADAEQRYAAAFKQAEDAMILQDARWRSPGATGFSVSGAPIRMLALGNELADNAEYRHRIGDDWIAVLRIKSLLHLARSLRSEPYTINQRLAGSVSRLAAEVLLKTCPDLRIEDAGGVSAMRELVAELGHEEKEMDRLGRTAIFSNIWLARTLIDDARSTTWFHAPVFDRRIATVAGDLLALNSAWSKAEWLDEDSQVTDCFGLLRRRDYFPFMGIPCGTERLSVAPPSRWRLMNIDLDSINGVGDAELNRLSRVEMRFARVALAVRLFRHVKGRYPARIDELVPEFMPEVPQYLGYEPNRIEIINLRKARADGSDRRLLFADGDSNTGVLPPFFVSGGRFSNGMQVRGRQWRDIEPWPATAYPPATQATPRYESGFEASGLVPSPHSPGLKQNPRISQ